MAWFPFWYRCNLYVAGCDCDYCMSKRAKQVKKQRLKADKPINLWSWLNDHLIWRPGEEWNMLIRQKYGHYKILLPSRLKHKLVSLSQVKREFGVSL